MPNKMLLRTWVSCHLFCGAKKPPSHPRRRAWRYALRETMKFISTFVLLFCMASASFGKDDCSLEGIDLSNTDDIAQRLFYTGTCHYRNKDYDKSAESWEKLAMIEEVNPDYKDLQIDVLNNLGYLRFFGYGVKENKEQAIEYWKKAHRLFLNFLYREELDILVQVYNEVRVGGDKKSIWK